MSTILDEIMGWAGIYLLRKITLTKTMTVDFIKPVHVGEPLKAQGEIVGESGKREARIKGRLFNSQGDLCAQSTGRFAMLTPALAKRLGVMTAQEITDLYEPVFQAD